MKGTYRYIYFYQLVNSIIYLCNTTLWLKGLEIKHILLLLSKLYFSCQTWKKGPM